MNIVIVGGGFGGVKSALELAKKKTNQITLISSTPYFQYYPALYSTATGHSYKESWVPLTKIFKKHTNVRLVQDTIMKIIPDEMVVSGSTGKLYKYDELILSLGSVTTYFGIEGLDTYAYGIKSEQEIRALQKHLIDEMSDGSDDEKNYVIIGAGPTGVELAGALGDYLTVLRKKYKVSNQKLPGISLVEAAPRVLPRMSEKASEIALARLQKLGINVELGKKVERETADALIVDGKPLASHTVIWTSGVANAPFYKANGEDFTLNERSKVVVDEFMQARPHVYVIGDNAATPYAGLAQTALHDAQFVARRLSNKNSKAYKAVLPSSVVPIGHGWALFERKKILFGGWMGNLLRNAADVIGYHDVLPIGWALGTWKAGKKRQVVIPENVLEN